MKTPNNLILAVILLSVALLSPGCTSVPTTPTDRQVVAANATEDFLALGLVPVLSKNPTYIPMAASIASTLGMFSGSTLTTDDVDAFLSKTAITPEDRRIIAGLVNAAWARYQKRYAEQVGSAVRPDVKLFLSAAARGITAAIEATPK